MLLRLLLMFFMALSSAPQFASAQPFGKTAAEMSAEEQAVRDHSAYTLSAAKLRQAIDLNRKRTVLEFADTGWTILQLVLMLIWGRAAWMRRIATGFSKNRWIQGGAFYFVFLGVTSLLTLPLQIYGHHVSLAYGESIQLWGSWFLDKAKEFLLAYLVGVMLFLLLFFVIGKSPKRWWFWFWVPAMAATVFGVFVTPIFIDPLFDTFEPLQQSNPALVVRLEQVVARGSISIPPDRMFLMKASEKVTGLNAYVTGIGASKRVVVWDTTIAKSTPDEISYIFAHEMGHYVLNHIYKGLGFAAAGLLAMFFVGYHCVQWLIVRYGARWGVFSQQDWGAFVVIMLVLSVLSFIAEPIGNVFSRSQEHAADIYGQEAIHGIVADPQSVARHSFQVLGEESLVDPTPHPFVDFWTASHPSIAYRAAFAAAYNPWAPGQQPKFFKK